MKKNQSTRGDERTKLYAIASSNEHAVEYSGLEFADFINGLENPIRNILLLKGNHIGDKCKHNFELLEGESNIKKFILNDIYKYGDFCFVDYENPDCIDKLHDEQIAELLFMAHLFRPLKKPFFDVLGNRFAYLSHDDGFYCKLYCQDHSLIVTLLANKIIRYLYRRLKISACEFPAAVNEIMFDLMKRGLFIDLEELSNEQGMLTIKLFVIGKFGSMDSILNNRKKIKITETKNLIYYLGKWTIS